MKLYIRNMVCNRCITSVKAILDKSGIQYDTVELGEVTIFKKISSGTHSKLHLVLMHSGFDLIDNRKYKLIEKLKNAIVDLENYSDENLKTSYSDYISLSVSENFNSLNNLLSEMEGITIEKHVINQKIELVKELLLNNDLDLAEIAKKMHYSSAAQLSSQFKSITGLTPANYRQLQQERHYNKVIN